jgi:hypothetical protein
MNDIKTAWNISKVMTKGNLLSIFLFSLVVSLLSQIGVLACGIGIFLTMPFMYTPIILLMKMLSTKSSMMKLLKSDLKMNFKIKNINLKQPLVMVMLFALLGVLNSCYSFTGSSLKDEKTVQINEFPNNALL